LPSCAGSSTLYDQYLYFVLAIHLCQQEASELRTRPLKLTQMQVHPRLQSN
jgi:hypothetical protein